MNANWINFKELRSKLSFAEVLKHYGKEVSEKGNQLVGFCPLPLHNGNRNSPSFSAHPDKGIFHCFGCGAKGNVLDFCVAMEGGNPRRGLDVRRIALKLTKQFNISFGSNGTETRSRAPKRQEEDGQSLLVNEPLNFRLKDLDGEHPYLKSRGFSREIMEKFGVGFCSKGGLVNRIAIPLHNGEKELIGYAGRIVDDTQISAKQPKYLFPGKRDSDGSVSEFKKSLFLYNGWRFKEPLLDLIVVEGFPAVWWLTQCGFNEVVAIMGSSCSPEQKHLLLELTKPEGRIWIMTDGDRAGRQCAGALARDLAEHRLVRTVINEGKQPTDYSEEELKTMLGS
jgi:DNA primase